MTQLLKRFYLLSGIPGSGKSTWAKKFPEALIIVHDQLLSDNFKIMSKTAARKHTHQQVIDILNNLTSDIVIFDSVNPTTAGRQFLLNQVPNDYQKTIIYFIPPSTLVSSDEYAQWLLSVRQQHVLFPGDIYRATSTIDNLRRTMEPISDDEQSKYEIIIEPSYYNR